MAVKSTVTSVPKYDVDPFKDKEWEIFERDNGSIYLRTANGTTLVCIHDNDYASIRGTMILSSIYWGWDMVKQGKRPTFRRFIGTLNINVTEDK